MYEALASFAQTWGLLFFFAVFIGVLIYALWPKNRAKFDAASRMPLNDEDAVIKGGKRDD
ncbi:cbb3-type cytochrome c oxidase subunit 3 [Hyphobacterium sp.]|uniref:cbb3-type cytochrome c oxidase subunit 3 n=1 Tax=Hyphobacterium sp. TaxID=2004662 RepID=UPI003BACDAAD